MGIRAFIHGIARIASSQNGSAIAQNRDAPYTVLVGYPANPKAGYRISVRPFLSSSSFLLHIPCDTSSPSLSLLFILSTSFPAPHTFLPSPSLRLSLPLSFYIPCVSQIPSPSSSGATQVSWRRRCCRAACHLCCRWGCFPIVELSSIFSPAVCISNGWAWWSP